MISNDSSKKLVGNTNQWNAYNKQADMNEMLQSSLCDLNLSKPPPVRTPVPARQPSNTFNGPTAAPPRDQYMYPQPQQGFYVPLPAWVKNKGSIPPLYQQVCSQCADPRQSYYMLTDRIQPLLISSGLDQEKLKAIWNLSSRTFPGVLTLTECYTALGLVALAQQGHEISMDKLADLSFTPIPRVDTTRCTLYPIPNPTPVQYIPATAADRTAPFEPQGFGGFHSANSNTSLGDFQQTGSKQEFGNFQSASPTTQNLVPLPVNNNNIEEFGQLNSASPIQPSNTELTSLASGAVISDQSDKYNCFRDIGDVQSFSSADTNNQDTAQPSDSGAHDKYAFLRSLDVTNEQKETLPPLSLNSNLLQPTQTPDDQGFSEFKSADSNTPLQSNPTMNRFDTSIFDTTATSSDSTSQLNHTLVPSTGTPVVPDGTSEFSDLSNFSMFLQATNDQCTVPSEAAANFAGPDWSAFTSNAGPIDSDVTPGADKYSVFSHVQGDNITPLSNLLSNLGDGENENMKINKQQTTADTDWTACTTTTTVPTDNILPPNSDKYSVFSQLQSAVPEQLCVLPPSEPSAVSDAGVPESQTITDLDWSAFTSTTITTTITTTTTHQNQNNITPTDDKYSVFSQFQSAACVPSSPSPGAPPASSYTGRSNTHPAQDGDEKVTKQNEILSTQKLVDYSLTSNTILPPFLDTYSSISEIDNEKTAQVAQAPVSAPPTERDKQDLSKLPARQLSTERDSFKDFSYNEPPPLDDVPNNDETNEDFSYSGFSSFPELPEPKYKRQAMPIIKQNKQATNSQSQNILSIPLAQAHSSDVVTLEGFDTQPSDATPLAAQCTSLFCLAAPTLPTQQLEATENDFSADPGEKTPLANTAQIKSHGPGGSQLDNDFSIFSHFQTAPGDKSQEELNCNSTDLGVQLKGSNDFSLPHETFIPSQNLDFSEFSSFQTTSDSTPEETLEAIERNFPDPDPDPFQDLSFLSTLQSNDLMKGQTSKPQEHKWTLFDTLATALQDINSVPIDNYKNQKFQPKKEPISGIQREESFSTRRSPLPPEARDPDFGEFTGASNTGVAHKQLSRAPSYRLNEDSSKEVREAWSQTLSASVRVIHSCFDKVKSATSVQILKELCTHDTSHQYFQSVFEVMKIVSRIKKQLPPGWEESNLAYEEITGDWANIKAYLNHGGLEFSDIIVSAGADSEGSGYHCGVCLDVIMRDDTRIAFGGFNYHSTCANFWLNEVRSMLPRLSRESHGTSL